MVTSINQETNLALTKYVLLFGTKEILDEINVSILRQYRNISRPQSDLQIDVAEQSLSYFQDIGSQSKNWYSSLLCGCMYEFSVHDSITLPLLC